MSLLSQLLAGATALALAVVFILEAFFHRRQALYPHFLIREEDVPAVRMRTINVGFCSRSFAAGITGGPALLRRPGRRRPGAVIAYLAWG